MELPSRYEWKFNGLEKIPVKTQGLIDDEEAALEMDANGLPLRYIDADNNLIDYTQAERDEMLEGKRQLLYSELRIKRNELLSDCDWTTLNDCQLTEEKILEWSTYRQALRDLPETITDILNFDFENDFPINPE